MEIICEKCGLRSDMRCEHIIDDLKQQLAEAREQADWYKTVREPDLEKMLSEQSTQIEKLRRAIENYIKIRAMIHNKNPKTGKDYCNVHCFCRLEQILSKYKGGVMFEKEAKDLLLKINWKYNNNPDLETVVQILTETYGKGIKFCQATNSAFNKHNESFKQLAFDEGYEKGLEDAAGIAVNGAWVGTDMKAPGGKYYVEASSKIAKAIREKKQ